jgi:hypothetical protein
MDRTRPQYWRVHIPFRNVPIVITPALADVTGRAGNGTRLYPGYRLRVLTTDLRASSAKLCAGRTIHVEFQRGKEEWQLSIVVRS